jgi:GAF domain-containing protein
MSGAPDRLPASAPPAARRARYAEVRARLAALLEGEDDWIAALATVTAELHGAFGHFDWTGFYRAAREGLLVIGPYQGGHGCLRIPVARGICGAAARSRATQRVADVHARPEHIACSASTASEIVVPILTPAGRLLGVLDVDSDLPAAFTEIDEAEIEAIGADLGRRFALVEQL